MKSWHGIWAFETWHFILGVLIWVVSVLALVKGVRFVMGLWG